MRPNLRPHPIIGEFLSIVSKTSPLGLAGRALQPLVVQAALDLLPRDIRSRLGLSARPVRLAVAEFALSGLGRAARRMSPPVVRDAYDRMGAERGGIFEPHAAWRGGEARRNAPTDEP